MTVHKNNNKNQGKIALLASGSLMMIYATAFAGPIQANAQLSSGLIGGVAGGVLGGCASALTSAIGGLFGGGGGASISGGAGTGLSIGGNAVPVADASVRASVATISSNTTSTKNVQCTWNGVAWQMAHIVLHMMTTSIVNWINSGFSGDPAFIKNPKAFFLDAADQVTGAFLAGSGPLSGLCSPFSVDIRVALALGQVTTDNTRYTCTLGAIIKNAQNGVNVTVNGQSVNGFMNGNFSQGGFPALITMATQPQNNPYGSFLQASSDLNLKIGERQASISADLQLGGGFLSWSNCQDVSAADANRAGVDTEVLGQQAGYDGANGKASYVADTGGTYTANVDNNGNVTYQDCTTQTPGSVISSSLSKSLGASTDELNMTNEINQVVSALFSQLVKTVITGGLLASSQSGSGTSGSQSYVDQLANDPQMNQNFSNLQQQAVGEISRDIAPIQQAIVYRSQTLALMASQQGAYAAVQACIANNLQQATAPQQSATLQSPNNSSLFGQTTAPTNYSAQTAYLQSQLTALNSAIAANITPQITADQSLLLAASSTLAQIQSIQYQVKAASTAQDLVNLNPEFTTELTAISSSSASDPQSASNDFQTATALSSTLSKALIPYQNVCNGATSNTMSTQ